MKGKTFDKLDPHKSRYNMNGFLTIFRTRLFSGVIKDIQRQRQRKIQNTYALQQQIELGQQLQKNLEQEDQLLLQAPEKS